MKSSMNKAFNAFKKTYVPKGIDLKTAVDGVSAKPAPKVSKILKDMGISPDSCRDKENI